DGTAYADLVAEYERLSVDQQFAQEAYTAARAAYDLALAEAQRQTRYLAAHIRPTLAEAPLYPERMLILALVSGFLLLTWSILVLVAYALRDRR
ncbi:MAG: capsule biosynthesis protein, partial [Pseudomonadota bacterium]